jgi:voltage-gated potassium channel
MMKKLLERKHLILLAVLVMATLVEPMLADRSERSRIFSAVVAALVNLGVLLVIFDQRWERSLALFLLAVVWLSNIVHEILPGRAQMAAVVYHCFALVFLGFVVAVILKRIFNQQAIRTDAVIGALCGYVLAAFAWGNAYALMYLLSPGSFRVADAIAGRLGEWYLQRFYFGYFSITTLTSLGYGDITPIGTLVLWLSWIEVLFGQFYIAVVVAQLVGLRLAQSFKRDHPDSE